jgi:hypothetical protein
MIKIVLLQEKKLLNLVLGTSRLFLKTNQFLDLYIVIRKCSEAKNGFGTKNDKFLMYF